MQIEVTLAELNNVVESLNNIVKVPIPAKYAYRFGKIAKQLQGELAELKSQRNELYKKYGESKENGNIEVKPEKLQDFYGEIEDLLSETIKVVFEPMPISLLADSNVTIADMAWLENFFVDDLDDTPAKEGNDDDTVEKSQEEAVTTGA